VGKTWKYYHIGNLPTIRYIFDLKFEILIQNWTLGDRYFLANSGNFAID